MHIFKTLTVAFLMVYASGCGCTEVGCNDGMVIDLKKGNDAWEPGKYLFALDEDGKKSNCTVELPFTKAPNCTAGIQLFTRAETADASSTDPELHQVLTFSVATHVTLTISRDGVEIAKGDYTPTYKEDAPNGETCGPVCHNTSEVLTIP